MTDVFISYSRKDKDFAQQLHNALKAENRDAWIDWEDIPLTADWWQEIQRGIEAADTFVFILSPDSVASKVCGEEVTHAVEQSKRLVPIVHRQGFDMQQIDPALAKHNWLFFREEDDFNTALRALLHAIDTDIEYVHTHTRLLVRAIEWDRKERNESFLLRGIDLEEAEQWLTQGVNKRPSPADRHVEYIATSRKAETLRQKAEVRRQRILLSVIAVFSLLSLATATFALQQRQIAQTNEQKANDNAKLAQRNAQHAEQQTELALKNAQEAQQQASLARKNAETANQQTVLAKQRRAQAEAAQAIANQRQREAEQAEAIAEQRRQEAEAAREAETQQRQKAIAEEKRAIAGQQQAVQNHISALASLSEARLIANDQLESLLTGLKAGQELKQSPWTPTSIRVKTVAALQQTLYSSQELNRLEGHTNLVSSVQVSPTGQLIASGSWDGTLKLWQANGKLRWSQDHLLGRSRQKAEVIKVTFSPDEKLLASGDSAGIIKLWRVADGTLVGVLDRDSPQVVSLSFSPNGQTLAVGKLDGTVKLWRMSDRSHLQTLLDRKIARAHDKKVLNLHFSQDGQILTSTSQDGTVKRWQVAAGALLKTLTLPRQDLTSVAFSPDDKLIAYGNGTGQIAFIGADGAVPSPTFLPRRTPHSGLVTSLRFSRNGQLLASTSQDGSIKLWQLEGTLLETFNGQGSSMVRDVDFSPDQHRLLSASDDRTLRIWRVRQDLPWHNGSVLSVKFSPDGTLFASAGFGGMIQVRRTADRRLLQTLNHPRTVYSVSFSPDSQQLASAGSDQTIKLWDLKTGTLLTTLRGHQDVVYGVAFSPDGQLLASASEDQTIKLWSMPDYTLRKTLGGHTSAVKCVSFSPDGQTLASASLDQTVKLWQFKPGTLLHTLSEHQQGVNCVSFSPDGQTIASASGDTTVKLWRVATGAPIRTLTGHQTAVTSVSFSPDGSIVASAALDGKVKLWNAQDGSLIFTLNSNQNLNQAGINSLSFNPTGDTLISGTTDKRVLAWSLNIDTLLSQGCDLAQNYLLNNLIMQRSDLTVCPAISRIGK